VSASPVSASPVSASPAPARLAQCALAHAVDAAVAARPAIATGGASALAAHVTEAIRAWAEHRQWRCSPDEPEWLLGAELTEEAIVGVTRPAVLAGPDTVGAVDGLFIDCQWALGYLGPGAHRGPVGGEDSAPLRD
jgi:hypothetical protein